MKSSYAQSIRDVSLPGTGASSNKKVFGLIDSVTFLQKLYSVSVQHPIWFIERLVEVSIGIL